MSFPSVKSLVSAFRITEQEAKLLRAVYKGKIAGVTTNAFKLTIYEQEYPLPERRLIIANKIIGGYGVEALENPDATDPYYPHAIYVNTGDTYSPTLLYDYHTRTTRLTTWGGYVEAKERQGYHFR